MKRTCTFCGPQITLLGELAVLGLTCPTCGQALPWAGASVPAGGARLCDVSSGDDPLRPLPAGGPIMAEPAGTDEEIPGPIPVELPAYPSAPPGMALVPFPLQRLSPARRPVEVAPVPLHPGSWRGRFLHGLFGSLLLMLFFMSWGGARSWELLPVLQGAAFVRQLLLLVAGVTLLSTAVLPVPPLFRGVIGLLLGVFGLSLGGVMLSPWQNLMAALAVLLLPAALILVSWHSRGTPDLPTLRMQRALGLLGAVAVLALYLVPREGALPLRVAVELLRYNQDDAARFLGTYLLLPLPLLGFSLVALLSEDVAILGELLGWLLCSYGPGAILILLIDNTQAYVALAVLGYALCGAYGLVAVLQRLSVTAERDSLR